MSTISSASGPEPCPLLWRPDLARENPAGGISWIWRGYAGRGAITLLSGPWKGGKTTLFSVLLSRLGAGGTLAGLPVARGRAIVVSEEPPSLWDQRATQLDFGQHVCWLCRPFPRKPSFAEWEGLIERLALLGADHNLTLAIIDPLATFLPGRDENSAAAILAALLPLRRLTAVGMSVLLGHHPSKAARHDGVRFRGSGALGGHADVLIEMNWLEGPDPNDRRRRLRSFSRYGETLPEQVIELNTDGTDYTALGDVQAEWLARHWPGLRTVLLAARRKLSRSEILEVWPPQHGQPSTNTLWRWLEREVEAGRVLRDGDGTRTEPYRYWLPGQMEIWQRDPLGLLNQQE